MHTPTASVRAAFGPAAAGSGVASAGLALERGASLGSYQLVLPIGAGGMGRVWIAAKRGDFGFERMFAVKVMREELAEDVSFRRMFLDEAKLAARLRHTNVVEVLDLGEDCGTVYQAMALVDGNSLSGLLSLSADTSEGGTVLPEIAGRVVADILRGLHAAHQLTDELGRSLELVHRDVSPQNILIGLDGVSKIADFGVAKAIGKIGESNAGVVGKRSYMAPEQLRGEPVDRRCDVFAAGVVLWELLVGKRSMRAGEALLEGRALDHPCAVRPRAHAGLAEVAMAALAARPEDRYASADAMADAIEQAAFRSGLALSTKHVGAWVSELVGTRVSRQRAEARRELEVSQVSRIARHEHAGAEPRRAEPVPALEVQDVPDGRPRSGRGLVVGVLVATVALLIAAVALGARLVASRAPSASFAPSSELPAGEISAAITSMPTVEEKRDAVPSPSASASTPTSSSVSRPTRPHPRPTPRSSAKPISAPNLPYDNPYKR